MLGLKEKPMFLKEEHVCLWLLPKLKPIFGRRRLRHAAEHRFREQLASLGVRLPRLIPFGSQGIARLKRWHHVKDKDVWQHPMQKVTIYGPAYDMSPTSNGYYVECDGRWMRSTVVIQPHSPEPAAGQTVVQVSSSRRVRFSCSS